MSAASLMQTVPTGVVLAPGSAAAQPQSPHAALAFRACPPCPRQESESPRGCRSRAYKPRETAAEDTEPHPDAAVEAPVEPVAPVKPVAAAHATAVASVTPYKAAAATAPGAPRRVIYVAAPMKQWPLRLPVHPATAGAVAVQSPRPSQQVLSARAAPTQAKAPIVVARPAAPTFHPLPTAATQRETPPLKQAPTPQAAPPSQLAHVLVTPRGAPVHQAPAAVSPQAAPAPPAPSAVVTPQQAPAAVSPKAAPAPPAPSAVVTPQQALPLQQAPAAETPQQAVPLQQAPAAVSPQAAPAPPAPSAIVTPQQALLLQQGLAAATAPQAAAAPLAPLAAALAPQQAPLQQATIASAPHVPRAAVSPLEAPLQQAKLPSATPPHGSDCDTETGSTTDEAVSTDGTAACKAAVDLSGSWLLSRVEGDFEALMADAGVSWAVRKLARGAGYGSGMVRHEIKQDVDELEIVFKTRPGKTDVMKVQLGVDKQSTSNEDGTPIVVYPRWEGGVLTMSGTNADGSTMQATRRYLDGQELVCESCTSTGSWVAKRVFSRA